MTATLLTVGGLDTSGGAGLARDAIVASGLGVLCQQVATLISAQNHFQAAARLDLDTCLHTQLAALPDAAPDAIKLGALTSAAVDALVPLLDRLQQRGVPVVWDPVIDRSAGGRLSAITPDTLARLAPRVSVMTPNTDELASLTGCTDIPEGIARLKALGCPAVLVKGGHQAGPQAEDILATPDGQWHLCSPRHAGTELRGTGCILATALACALAQGYALHDAACVAKAVINQQFRTALAVSDGLVSGAAVSWPTQAVDFPKAWLATDQPCQHPFAPLTHPTPGLYPVVDSCQWLERVLRSGVNIAQLRIKHGPPAYLNAQIRQAVALGRQYKAQVFINDLWQLALEHDAYGVHLGQEDLADADLSRLARAGLRLGVSTHGYAELCRSLPLRPSYIALGHIFATQTKVMPSSPQGLTRLLRYRQLCRDIPTVAIGGIGRDKVAQVWATGVSSVAMVSGITQAPCPEQTIVEIQHILSSERPAND